MDNEIFHNDCHKCGYSGESKFSISGTHLKQKCGNCGFYIKFLDHKLFPSVADLRLKIWQISGGSKELIEIAKSEISFTEIRNPDTSKLTVADMMTANPIIVNPEEYISQVEQLMMEKKITNVLVGDETSRSLVGVYQIYN